MESLLNNKDNIFFIKKNLDSNMFYDRITIHKNKVTQNTISIVMCASNRSNQLYYSLKTFTNSIYKDIQVIIVDDSTTDPILLHRLREYPFTIEFIKIKKDKKIWFNPCVNYNIGFLFVKGGQVIIQNSEVCHVGDVINYVRENAKDNKYLAFNVKASDGFESNSKIYEYDTLNLSIYDMPYFSYWYQCAETFSRCLHFLTAMTRETFDKIGGFSFDYSFGFAFDDDDFVLKIRHLSMDVIALNHLHVNCGGIHLHHVFSEETWGKPLESNKELFINKNNKIHQIKKYIEVTESKDTFEEHYNLLKS